MLCKRMTRCSSVILKRKATEDKICGFSLDDFEGADSSAGKQSGRAFAKTGGGHLLKVFVVVGYIERQGGCKVFPDEAMDKKLAHQFFQPQDFLHA